MWMDICVSVYRVEWVDVSFELMIDRGNKRTYEDEKRGARHAPRTVRLARRCFGSGWNQNVQLLLG